jgi:hypothetical protein
MMMGSYTLIGLNLYFDLSGHRLHVGRYL